MSSGSSLSEGSRVWTGSGLENRDAIGYGAGSTPVPSSTEGCVATADGGRWTADGGTDSLTFRHIFVWVGMQVVEAGGL